MCSQSDLQSFMCSQSDVWSFFCLNHRACVNKAVVKCDECTVKLKIQNPKHIESS